MATITELSDEYVVRLAAASPLTATYIGVPGHDDRLDDLSPDGLAERSTLAADTLQAVRSTAAEGGAEEIAKAVIAERLAIRLETYEAGFDHANLNVIASPVQDLRLAFDLMPLDTEDDWATITRRMAAVPDALSGYRTSLLAGAQGGVAPAVRQVVQCAIQAATYGGARDQDGYFAGIAARHHADGALGRELAAAAEVADGAYVDLADFLLSELKPLAPVEDAVGEDRYRIALRDFTGAELDLVDCYQWGWQEFLEIEAELHSVAAQIAGSPAAAADALDRETRYLVSGRGELQGWIQHTSDAAVEALGGTEFDIPDEIRRLECLIAPPGGSLGAYYTGPSADLSRPGRMWWSVAPDRVEFSTWREKSVVYHEGVPGHHLQIATQVWQRDRLNDYQRLLAGTSGHAEGWALYAERLMRELGYLDDPGDLLGMLNEELFRAARVLLDIGMHLQLPIPAGTGFHEGQRWTGALGLEFLLTRTLTEPGLAKDEIDRYLGWPGQAPSYKLGERVWLQARAAAKARHGHAFDQKAFHTAALQMGGMGLDPLRELLDGF